MKRHQISDSSRHIIPPEYEQVFHITKNMIQNQSSVWSEYMTIMEIDAKMISENRFPLPPSQNHTVQEILNEVSNIKCSDSLK